MTTPRSAQPVPFMIISPPRSGSWLVWTSLAQHPRIAIFGELFNDELYAESGGLETWRSPPTIACRPIRPGDSGARYLDEEVFSRFARSKFRAVGFKLLYGQAQHDRRIASMWDYLTDCENMYVIHLHRANLLECLVSLKTALATDRWFAQSDAALGDHNVSPVWLSPEECAESFRLALDQRRQIDRMFARHRTLALEYETDLVGQYRRTMDRVQAFLGLHLVPVSPALKKQARKPLRDRIANFQELRRAFEGSRFAPFFGP